MRKRAFHIGCLLASVIVALPALAQEGHPLTGTWSGDWGPSVTERNHLTLVMEFDGDGVTGLMNPGPNSIDVDAIALDVTNWTVRIEASWRGRCGKCRQYHGRRSVGKPRILPSHS